MATNDRREQFAKSLYESLRYLINPKKFKESAKKWRIANPDKHRRNNREWRLANLDKCCEYVKQWGRLNPIKFREMRRIANRKWRAKHPEKSAVKSVRRRIRKQNTICGDPKLIDKIYARAFELRRWFDVVVDHIIPLAKGGAHSPENLQIIYAFENARKGDRLDYKPRVVFI